jgi:hypothetical protein
MTSNQITYKKSNSLFLICHVCLQTHKECTKEVHSLLIGIIFFCNDYKAVFLSSKECHSLKLKTKLHGLSPRANYADQATAACRRSDCQLLWIEGATWSA